MLCRFRCCYIDCCIAVTTAVAVAEDYSHVLCVSNFNTLLYMMRRSVFTTYYNRSTPPPSPGRQYGHALGLYHEHSSPDITAYQQIRINNEAINPAK